MAGEPFYVCEGLVCRWRARDLELAPPTQTLPCLGRCDAPVAALTVDTAAPRSLCRELTILRRGHDPEPARPPGAQRGPQEPVLLRDLQLADQAALTTARRRGAYRTLELLPADLAQLLATATETWPAQARAAVLVVSEGERLEGRFALRPIFERDPHAVIEGLLLAAHAVQAHKVVLELRRDWPTARAEMARALADAVAAELTGDITIELTTSPPPDATLVVPPELIVALPHVLRNGADWWQQHAPRLVAVSGDVLRPGVYELPRTATIKDAIAASGGVVEGARTSTASGFVADGKLLAATDLDEPAPSGLIVAHARRHT